MRFISVIIKKFCQITKTEPTTIEHATRITTRSKSMQTDERSSPLKADSDNIFPCPCSVCVPTYGKDFSSETALMAPPRETMSRHHRLLGFTGPPIPMLPYTQIPGSPTRLLMPYALHRAPYQRAVFAPDACYRSGSVQETPKQEILRESHLIQTESLTPNPDASGRYWDRSGSKYSNALKSFILIDVFQFVSNNRIQINECFLWRKRFKSRTLFTSMFLALLHALTF